MHAVHLNATTGRIEGERVKGMETKHICFECEGEKWHTIPHECGGPDVVPCEACKGEGTLVYDEVQIKYFFPDYVLPKAIVSTKLPSDSVSRIGGFYE